MDKEDLVRKLTVSDDSFKSRMIELENEIESKCALVSKLQGKIVENQRTIDSLLISRKSEGTALLEVEHLKSDNERLLKLLKCT